MKNKIHKVYFRKGISEVKKRYTNNNLEFFIDRDVSSAVKLSLEQFKRRFN